MSLAHCILGLSTNVLFGNTYLPNHCLSTKFLSTKSLSLYFLLILVLKWFYPTFNLSFSLTHSLQATPDCSHLAVKIWPLTHTDCSLLSIIFSLPFTTHSSWPGPGVLMGLFWRGKRRGKVRDRNKESESLIKAYGVYSLQRQEVQNYVSFIIIFINIWTYYI